MKIYLRIVAAFYFLGFALHLADLLDLRLNFSEMSAVWQIWIIYLTVFDLFAAIGLWQQRRWGIVLFIVVAISQLVAYLGFTKIFGDQTPLIIFHVLTLVSFCVLDFTRRRSAR